MGKEADLLRLIVAEVESHFVVHEDVGYLNEDGSLDLSRCPTGAKYRESSSFGTKMARFWAENEFPYIEQFEDGDHLWWKQRPTLNKTEIELESAFVITKGV